MTVKQCSECLSEIPAAATTCRFCGERIEGKPCPSCMSVVKAEASTCRWCHHAFKQKAMVSFDSFSVRANGVATLFVRGRLLAQTVRFDSDKITVVTPGLFNLTSHVEEIPWAKIAGFDYRSGFFWDLVRIETRGQTSTGIGCLNKEDGHRIREILQSLEK